MSVKIHRHIVRRITVGPAEIYAALMAKFDIPSADAVQFDDEAGLIGNEITLIATETVETEPNQ